jgi:hypothetical protein
LLDPVKIVKAVGQELFDDGKVGAGGARARTDAVAISFSTDAIDSSIDRRALRLAPQGSRLAGYPRLLEPPPSE